MAQPKKPSHHPLSHTVAELGGLGKKTGVFPQGLDIVALVGSAYSVLNNVLYCRCLVSVRDGDLTRIGIWIWIGIEEPLAIEGVKERGSTVHGFVAVVTFWNTVLAGKCL